MIATISDFGSNPRALTDEAGPDGRTAVSRDAALHDAELVRRFRFGDEDAFAAIVGRYRDKMLSLAFRHLRNHSDAEEIAQDTFIRAHRGLAGFRGESSLSTWLHRIAFNLSRNRHKHNFCRRRHATVSLDFRLGDGNRGTIADLIVCEAPGPARIAASGEFSEIVARCMEELGPRQREILVLRNVLSRSYDEIARTLGLSVGTVKSRIGRARESLRALLAQAYPQLAAGSDFFGPLRPMGRVAIACS